ncbi:UDP-N-acetylglucosamine 4,6-dehydratase [Terribacillus saccharophilus]|uniref:polysaccharide biosynthesis protein n=1 Tax=Terribacillus saccharophilus TaxID=361277 RepID=UPI000BA6616C|nr:polysaccharide biosynthesis protein [Terribacillus saccharophilus]PAF39638.1 UDP-N-acetylglucosamine 4,6-dehydratase [Terribacillus saccharophilus]
MFKDKTIFITGGTGSWGYELVRQLLQHHPKEIRIFSRNESHQFTMKQEFDNNPKLHFKIGDIRDREALIEATDGVDYLFHLAALKHVPVCEDQPLEALKTNVIGTQHVIDAAIHHKIDKVIYISTDKASDPANFYGLSKAMGERLITHANTLHANTTFVCIRGGNVLGTNGSVIHVFKKAIRQKGKIGITDPEMTRFFLTVEDAIKLVFKATFEAVGGEIFIMKMPAIKITDLAKVLMEASGAKKIEFDILGIRPGEKIHELLLTVNESHSAILYDDRYFVILPDIKSEDIKKYYKDYKKVEITNYNSSQNLLSLDEIKTMLAKGGFI